MDDGESCAQVFRLTKTQRRGLGMGKPAGLRIEGTAKTVNHVDVFCNRVTEETPLADKVRISVVVMQTFLEKRVSQRDHGRRGKTAEQSQEEAAGRPRDDASLPNAESGIAC